MGVNRKITIEQSNFAKKMIKEGFTYMQISEELNLTWGLIKNHLNREGYYSENLKRKIIECLNCGNSISNIDFINGKRVVRTKFCNNSCSASFSNKFRIRNKKKEKPKCVNCEGECKTNFTKYCSVICHSDYRNKKLIERINNNDTDGLSDVVLKRIMILMYGEKCMKCGWNEINETTKKVPIELNHKDGNSKNNNSHNVELICPNCHSLTPNYKALNKGNGRHSRRQRARDGKSY